MRGGSLQVPNDLSGLISETTWIEPLTLFQQLKNVFLLICLAGTFCIVPFLGGFLLGVTR